MRSYARSQGSQTSIANIRKDMLPNDSATLDTDTVSNYISALKKIFVIEDLPAWNPNLRSKSAIRTSDTRYFVDPSIAVAALGLGPLDLVNDLETFGLIFETLCIRDLRVYAEAGTEACTTTATAAALNVMPWCTCETGDTALWK